MTRSLRKFLYGIVLVCAYFLPVLVFGQVSVTSATTSGGVKICEKGAPVALSDIKITESTFNDIGGDASDHSGVTLILEAPAGFNFVNGAGAGAVSPGGDVSNVSLNWTLTTITLTFDVFNNSGPHVLDEVTISGLQILAVSGIPQNSVNVVRNGGTASVVGLLDATAVGTVSSTVNTTRTVAVNDNTICVDQGVSVTIASSESGINYRIFNTSNTPLSSSFTGTGSDLTIPTSSLSSTPTSQTLKVIASDASAGCSTELQQQQNVTVVSLPTANAGGSGEACYTAGTYKVTSANFSNGAIAWSHNGQGTFDNTTIISPTYTFSAADAGTIVTFTLTVTGAGSCGSVNDAFNLTITSPPLANAGSDEAICFNETFNFGTQSTPATGSNYSNVTWTTNGLGILNNPNTLIPNYIPAVNESGLITFTLTSHSSGSCVNATDQMVLTIHPKASFTVSNTTAVPFCSGGADAITLNSSTAGAVVRLVSVTPSDAAVTGFTPAGTLYSSFPITIADNLVNVSTAIQTVVYEFEVRVAGCANPALKTATVTVRPIPNLSVANNSATPICSGSATDIDLTDPTSGVVISVAAISVSPTPGGVTGYSAVNSTFANGSKVTNVLVNTTSVQQTVTYTFRSTANGCTDPVDEIATVTVQPSPVFTVTNTLNSICSGNNTAIQLSSTASGAAIRLVSVTPSNAGVSGFTSAGTVFSSLPVTITNNLTNTSTSVQTVVYEFEVSVAGCVNPVHKTATVTVRPIPDLSVVNNIATPICSGGATNIDLSDPTSGVVISIAAISVSPTSGGVTGYSPVGSTFANGSKVTNVLVNTTSVQQTVTYTFRSSGNGCADPVDEIATAVVAPAPAFTVTNSAGSICSGANTNLQLNSASSGAVVRLVSVTASHASVTGYTSAGATFSSYPATITDNLINPTASAQTIVYEFEVSIAGGCINPIRKTSTVTIHPIPSLTFNNIAPSIASGKNTNIDLFDSTNGVVITLETVIATDPAVSGYSTVGRTFTNGSKVTDVLVNSTSDPQTVTYGFRSSANGCIDPNLVNIAVTVSPGGVFAVTNGSPQICSGNTTSLTVNSPTTGATVELVNVTPSNAGVTGFSSVNTVYTTFPYVINDNLINPTNVPQTVVYEFEVSVGGSPNPVHEFATVRINPIPALTVTNNAPSICSGIQTDIAFSTPTSSALITLISVTPGGVTGNSAAGTTFANGSHLRDVLTNPTGSAVGVTYNFEVTANGCTTGGYSATVTVSPTLNFTVTNHTPAVCSTGGQNIDLTTSVTGAKMTVTGVSISPAAGSVTGVLVQGTQYTSSFPGTETLTGILVNTTNVVQTVTYEFEMAVGSCVNPFRQTASIQVSPTPSMSIVNSSSSICSGGSTNITLNSPTSGAIITLTSVSYGAASGSLSNNTTYTPGSVINEVLQNTTSSPVSVSYFFEVSGNGCASGSYGTSVTVAPTLDFTVINHAPSFCSTGSQNIDLTTAASGAKITVTGVTISPTAGSVTGVLVSGTAYTSGFPGTQTLTGSLVNTSNTVQTVTYEFEMSNGSCVNPSRQSVSIAVYPTPSMSITNSTSSICSDTFTGITLNSPTNSAVITLTNVVYGGVTGSLSNNTTYTPGSVINELLQNTTSGPITVNYTFAVSANGCTTSGFTTSVVVNPNPDFTVTNANPVICNGGLTNISFTSTTNGHQINVAGVNYGVVTGGSVSAGSTVFVSGDVISEALTNNTNAPVDVVYIFNVTTPGTTPVCPVAIVNKQVIVRVQPALLFTYTNSAPSICSGSQTNITLLTSVSGSQMRLSNVNYNGANGTLSAGLIYTNNQKISETLINNTTSPVTVSYTIESLIGACTSATPQIIQVVVNPTPRLSSTLTPGAICTGTNFVYSATSATSGAGFNWSRAIVSGISQSAASGNGNINEVLTNTTSFPINVTYVYVTDANGCNNSPGQSVVVTVNPSPLLSSTLSPVAICSGANFIYTATSSTSGANFNWSRAAVSGISQGASSGVGNISEVLSNTTGSPVIVTYVYIVSANSCTNSPGQNVSVTIQPVPSVVDPSDQVVCHGTNTVLVDFTSTGVGTSYSWINNSPGIGLPASGFGNIAAFNAINTGSAPVIATITVTPHYGTCTGSSQNFTITVNPAPTLNNIPNQALCDNASTSAIAFGGVATTYDWVNNNTSIGLASSGAGVTGIPSFTTINTGNAAQIATITVTPKYINGSVTCTGATRTFTITVNPAPNVAANNQNICSGQTSTILISNPNGISGTTYSWTIGTVTGTVSGYSAGSGTVISQVLSSSAGGSVEYIITPSASGCVGSSISRIVNVNPVPAGNSVSSGTYIICSGTALNITPTSNVGSATYTWSGSNGSGGNGNITDSPVNNTNAPINITYTVIPKGPSPTFCDGASFAIIVTVNPNPSFVITNSTPSICSGTSPTVNVNSPTSGAVITLQSVNYGSLSNGAYSSGGSFGAGANLVEGNLTNTTNSPITITYTFSISTPATTPVCPISTTTQSTTVIVNPVPDVVAASQNICSGQVSNVILSNPNAVAGTSFSWTIGTITGTPAGYASGSGAVINQTLTGSGSVEYIITPSANGCAGLPITRTVGVYRIPVGNSVGAGTHVVCTGTLLNITPTSNVSGTTYAWTGTNGSGGSGKITDRPFNTTTSPVDVTYTLTPTGPSPTFCAGTAFTIVVTVNPSPQITNTPLSAGICSGTTLNFVPAVNVSGATYSWTSTVTGSVSGASATGNNTPITDHLINTGSTAGVVTYEITPTGPGGSSCAGSSVNYVVTVNPQPVGVNDSKTVCSDIAINYNLLLNVATLGNNVGSTYSWTATDNTNPGVTGESVGPKTGPVITDVITNVTNTDQLVTYTVTPTGTNGCAGNTFLITVTISAEPVGATLIASPICSGTTFGYNLQNNVNTSGNNLASNFTWIAASNSSISGESTTVKSGAVIDDVLINTTTTNKTVIYTVTPTAQAGGCVGNSFVVRVVVNPRPVFSAGPDLSVCVNELQKTLSGSFSFAPAGVIWSGGAGSFDDATIATPTYTMSPGELSSASPLLITFTLKAFGTGACADQTDNMVLTVNPLPDVVFFGLPTNTNPPQVAENGLPIELNGTQKGGLFTITPGSGISTTTQNPFDFATVNPAAATVYTGYASTINTITYTYTDGNGCTNSLSKNLIVNPITDIDFGIQGATQDPSGDFELCANLGPVRILGFPDPSEGFPPETTFESLTPGIAISSTAGAYYLETDGVASDTYVIRYTFRNEAGAISTKVRSVKLFASPVASFSSVNNCIINDVVFTDNSTTNSTPFPTGITQWQWNFGDNDFSTMKSPSKRYNTSNTYYVTLRVTTSQGCSHITGATDHPVRVGDVPDVNYAWSAICTNDFTNFIDKTTKVQGAVPSGISQITAFTWDFGDGDKLIQGIGNIPANMHDGRTTGTYKDPKHNYQSNAIYNATLTVDTNDGCSNSKTQKIAILLGGTPVTPKQSDPYLADFETSGGGWLSESVSPSDSSWLWGMPAGKTITSGASSANAWWTGKNQVRNAQDTYFSLEQSALNGPCFDLSQLNRPMVAVDYWSDTQNNVDGSVLQYSTDGGLSWHIIGPNVSQADRDEGVNWFNNTAPISSKPGQQDIGQYGWTGRSGGWKNGRFNLDMIAAAERNQVRLRMAFSSNDGNDGQYDGFAFDNIFVGEKQRNVLVEHFTDSNLPVNSSGDSYLDDLFTKQFLYHNTSDFNDVRYHITSTSIPDPLNLDNQTDPGARATYMGVSKPPTTLMDGIVNTKFTGKFTDITRVELDRRALMEPGFELTLDTIATNVSNTIKVRLTVKSKKNFTEPLIAQVILLENNVGTFKNVLRKSLFGSDGRTIVNSFAAGQSSPFENSGNEDINVPIVNSGQLSLIGYIQNKNTREIYQSIKINAPRKTGRVIVGLEEEVIPTTLNGITIYPNPANGVFNFGIPDQNTTQGYSWKLADQRGVVVKSGDFENAIKGQKQIDVSGLPGAMYFVIITGPGHSVVYRKLVVVNDN